MPKDLDTILKLEVPIIVRLGERHMSVREVTDLVPGAIIEIPKTAEEDLDLLVNNKQVATGQAVKVGENFGIRITFVGDISTRLAALSGGSQVKPAPAAPSATDAAALAEALLAGQV